MRPQIREFHNHRMNRIGNIRRCLPVMQALAIGGHMDIQRFEKFVPLIVAIISATALYMYQKHKEKETEIRKTRQEIYAEYLNTLDVERLMYTKEVDSKDLTRGYKARQKLKAEAQRLPDKWELEKGMATNKLAVFGESAVVRALAEHWRQTQPTTCGNDWKENLAFFRVMREHAMPEEPRLSDEDLAELVLRCTPAIQR
jgi:hypothetical protein